MSLVLANLSSPYQYAAIRCCLVIEENVKT